MVDRLNSKYKSELAFRIWK